MKVISCLLGSFLITLQLAAQQPLSLWYRAPAEKWTDALPLGNGRIGAMIYGGISREHIQFNEEIFWSGAPRVYARQGAYKYLQPIRDLLQEGKQEEADKLAEQHFMGMRSNETGYESKKAAWLKKMRSDETYAHATVAGAAWKVMQVPVPEGWEEAGLPALDGAVWFRVSFELPATWQGKEILLDLGKIRDEDYTYVNGKYIGHTAGTNTTRKYIIDASLLKAGKNVLAVQVINFYDAGGFTGRKGNDPFMYICTTSQPADTLFLDRQWKYKVQDDSPPPMPRYNADYLPFADILIDFARQDNITAYHRELDITSAVSAISYKSGDIAYRREYFISTPQQIMAMRFTADKTGALDFNASFSALHKKRTFKKIDNHTIAVYVAPNDGTLKAVAYLYITANGKLQVSDSSIRVSEADTATVYLTAATSFVSYQDVHGNPEAVCKKQLAAAIAKNYGTIKQAHIEEYQAYFNTFSIELGNTSQAATPTDERIQSFTPETDPSLAVLYLQYARYLLIAASRPGTMPANLQGIWNSLATPPWGSKYTTNINAEMNYWPAEPLHLAPCHQPLFKMIQELAVTGMSTAKQHYDAPGWVVHHNTDLWRGTAPVNAANHGIWVTGSGWLCQHLWEHFQFTMDTVFLRDTAYPLMKSAAVFYKHFLVKDKSSGWLISSPSNSPEQGGLVAGPAMDHQIIKELYRNCINAAGILQTDRAFADSLQQQLKQIAPDQVGRYGQLQEWVQDVDDTANKHRHISHLWAVYPGTIISWKDSALMHAAKQSLLYRGDSGTGWSLAWKTTVWARLKEADHAMRILNALMSPAEKDGRETGGVYKNLFDAHPPFQVDGNFGGAAGIAEMLLQSHNGYMELLPALPAAWPDGVVKGICARGGFVLNFSWKEHRLQQVEIVSQESNDCQLYYNGKKVIIPASGQRIYRLNGNLEIINPR